MKMLTRAKILHIKSGQGVLGSYGKELSIECDAVVLAAGATPNRNLSRAWKEAFLKFF